MDVEQRLVLELPLTLLWSAQGVLGAKRIRHISAVQVGEMLRRGPVEFAIAEVGKPLEWKRKEACYSIWKSEIKEHICEPEGKICPADFPDGYCYFASEWQDDKGASMVLLERHH